MTSPTHYGPYSSLLPCVGPYTVPHARVAALAVVPPAVAPVVVAVTRPAAHVRHRHIESLVTVTYSHMVAWSHMVVVTCHRPLSVAAPLGDTCTKQCPARAAPV